MKFLEYSTDKRLFRRDVSRSEGEEVGDVDEKVEEELDHSIRRKKRRDLRKEVVANSSSDEGKENPEGEIVNTSDMFSRFGFDVFGFGW